MPRKKRSAGHSQNPQPLPMAGILEPALLLLLRRGPQHGYGLIAGLQQGLLPSYSFDTSAVYRTLRQLERQGMIASDWEHQETQGPPRRVYHITPAGTVLLSRRMADLLATRDLLERLLEESEALRRG